MSTAYLAPGCFLEAHFVHGLAPFVVAELRHHLKAEFVQLATPGPATIRCQLVRDPARLRHMLPHLRTVGALYVGCYYAIPRPKALLGHRHFQQLLAQLALVQQASPMRGFRTLRLEAAGADSTIFRRLRQQLTQATALVDDPVAGELEIRVFPVVDVPNAWVVLCRLTPRPLATRTWRVADMPGALNATVAAAMCQLTRPHPTDHVLNLMCGSGTLLIERLLLAPAQVAVGCDIRLGALTAARQNLHAAGLADRVHLLHADATRLDMPAQSFDVLVADLPWGQLVGAHATNVTLYPRLLLEAARVARAGARFAVITHEARLFTQTLRQYAHLWQLCTSIRLNFKQLRPRLYLLQRTRTMAGVEEGYMHS